MVWLFLEGLASAFVYWLHCQMMIMSISVCFVDFSMWRVMHLVSLMVLVLQSQLFVYRYTMRQLSSITMKKIQG